MSRLLAVTLGLAAIGCGAHAFSFQAVLFTGPDAVAEAEKASQRATRFAYASFGLAALGLIAKAASR
jgi:hypothetical protein